MTTWDEKVFLAGTPGRGVYCISEECVGCGMCKGACPWQAVLGKKKQKHVIDPTLCQRCGTCWHACPRCAVEDATGAKREKKLKSRTPTAAIDQSACVGCQNCLLNCQQRAISYRRGLVAGNCAVDGSRCIGCASCLRFCVNDCIELG